MLTYVFRIYCYILNGPRPTTSWRQNAILCRFEWEEHLPKPSSAMLNFGVVHQVSGPASSSGSSGLVVEIAQKDHWWSWFKWGQAVAFGAWHVDVFSQLPPQPFTEPRFEFDGDLTAWRCPKSKPTTTPTWNHFLVFLATWWFHPCSSYSCCTASNPPCCSSVCIGVHGFSNSFPMHLW